MRSLSTQLTLAAIAASVTARKITKSETKSVTVEEDAGSSNVYYVGCQPGNEFTDCSLEIAGVTNTGCMEGDATCSNAADLGGVAGEPTISTTPSTPLRNDRGNLELLTPGVCESIIALGASANWQD